MHQSQHSGEQKATIYGNSKNNMSANLQIRHKMLEGLAHPKSLKAFRRRPTLSPVHSVIVVRVLESRLDMSFVLGVLELFDTGSVLVIISRFRCRFRVAFIMNGYLGNKTS